MSWFPVVDMSYLYPCRDARQGQETVTVLAGGRPLLHQAGLRYATSITGKPLNASFWMETR